MFFSFFISGILFTPYLTLVIKISSISGSIIIYSLWIVLIAITFWFTKFDNNVTILQDLLASGRYSATV
jgi:ABC-type uncharacterized transport system permease subunit